MMNKIRAYLGMPKEHYEYNSQGKFIILETGIISMELAALTGLQALEYENTSQFQCINSSMSFVRDKHE